VPSLRSRRQIQSSTWSSPHLAEIPYPGIRPTGGRRGGKGFRYDGSVSRLYLLDPDTRWAEARGLLWPEPVNDPARSEMVVWRTGEAGDLAFNPATIAVPSGSTVTWTNNDMTAHTVTFDDASADSGILDPRSTFDHAFATAGTFAYHCNIHWRHGPGVESPR